MPTINPALGILQAQERTELAQEQAEATRIQTEQKRIEDGVLETCKDIDQLAVDAATKGEKYITITMPNAFLDHEKIGRIDDYQGVVLYPVLKSQEITKACRELETKGYTLVVFCKQGNLELNVYIREEDAIGKINPFDYTCGDGEKLKEIKKRQFSPTTTQEQRLNDKTALQQIRYRE